MILREILKTIRQIEIRTNRIVTESLAGALNIKARVLTAKYAKYAKKEQRVLDLFCSCISRRSRFIYSPTTNRNNEH